MNNCPELIEFRVYYVRAFSWVFFCESNLALGSPLEGGSVVGKNHLRLEMMQIKAAEVQ